MIPVLDHLRSHGDRIAVLTDSSQLTYRELADQVHAVAREFGERRCLVMLETRNDPASLIGYLAALAGGHVALPVPAGRDHRGIEQAYRPDIVVDGNGIRRHRGGDHRLHDSCALLLSTSGSTGSPKLVRLSHENLAANACAIAEFLDIRETDRAATTLPMSYCYGLSVMHSHLLRGAALILTEHSVIDDEFWTLFRRHGGTTFAGVPYTFEMLERVGFETMDLPALRYVTQAGGRMHPERVRSVAELARRKGFDLFVMYGATEATARMAYLPPHLALSRPSSIGVPIPGGSLSIEPVDGWGPTGDIGELVYRGANVMMGYAHSPADLALGKTVETLHTGDIVRRAADGLYEIIGRTSRFVKMYGLRIDLACLESSLRDAGIHAFCTDDDDRLVIAATGPHDADDVARMAADASGVPASAVRAVTVAELPMLPSGKPDYPSVRESVRAVRGTEHGTADLRALFADVLHLDPETIDSDASFTDLGGNSLSYVAMSVRLERALGTLPSEWHRLPLRELLQRAEPRRRRPWWNSALETSVALRAAAIVLIVGSHAEIFKLWGGAHILLGVAGYNFARFCLTPVPRLERVRRLRNTIGWIAIPSIIWAAIALVVTDDYHGTNLLLANKFLGPYDSMTAGRLWFVEVLVWTLAALAALFLVPAVDRAERRRPFVFAVALLAIGMALRYDVLRMHLGHGAWFTMLAFWFFAAGWAAAKASATVQRLFVTAVLVVGLHGYFDSSLREAMVLIGLALLIWVPTIRCPAAVTVIAGILAEASLYTYLTHYQVIELFEDVSRPLGVVASLVAGVLMTCLATWVRKKARLRRLAVSAAGAPALR